MTVDIFALSAGESSRGSGESAIAKPSENLQLSSSFAIGEESESFGAGAGAFSAPPAEIVAPIDKASAVVRRGDSVRIDVVARTRTVGHFFPGGTVDAFDVWLELQAIDDKGQIVFWSGQVEDDGKGPVERRRPYVPLLSPRRAWESDQQAERLGSSIGAVCSTDSAGSR